MWLKILERVGYHVLLQLIVSRPQPLIRLIIGLSLGLSLAGDYVKRRRQVDDKRRLQELNRLLSLIEAGNSPGYSFEQVDLADYPDYMTHPRDAYFNPAIFKRQVGLFEKAVLLQAELAADFAIVGYRMLIMKFLPIGLMLGLKSVMAMTPGGAVESVIGLGFLATYYLAERIER